MTTVRAMGEVGIVSTAIPLSPLYTLRLDPYDRGTVTSRLLISCLAVAAVALGAATAPLPVIPSHRGLDAEPAMAAALEGIDPAVDGWESEVAAEAIERQLARIAAIISSGGRPAAMPAIMKELETLVADVATGAALRPTNLKPIFDNGAIVVSAAPATSRGSAGSLWRGRDGLAKALVALAAPLAKTSAPRVDFQLFRLDLGKDGVASADVLFHAGAAGAFEATATWRMRWQFDSAGNPPRLTEIKVDGYREASGSAPGPSPPFADITEAVLGKNSSFTEDLRFGVDHWMDRTESWIESDSFGHHGIAVGDVNGDGLDDLYVAQMGGHPNLLFVQNPDGTATDRSMDAGVDWLERTRGVLLADFDNDGDQDLAVATSVALLLMANDGKGHFSIAARLSVFEGGVEASDPNASTSSTTFRVGGDEGGHYYRGGDLGGADSSDLVSLAAADYNNDGRLDLYACTYHASSEATDRFPIPMPYHDAANGGQNLLLRNDGEWRFTNATEEAGLNENNTRFSFAAAWEDYDDDGDMDLAVANDFGRKNLYRNDGGRFKDVAAAAGVEDVGAGMSAAWGDYDGDGRMDLYVANMFTSVGSRIAMLPRFQPEAGEPARALFMRHARGNSLFRSRGDGTFEDVSLASGTTMGRWAWGSNFFDADNDGREDLLVTNGYFTKEDRRDLASLFWRRVVGRSPLTAVDPATVPEYAAGWRDLGRMIRYGHSLSGGERNVFFLNTGDGTFTDLSAYSGLDFIDDARAAAMTDWDGDGDVDVWLANRTGPRLRLARNESASANRFIALRLQGTHGNRDAIGARATLHLPGGRVLARSLRAGEGYLAQSSKWLHFGLADVSSIERLVVRWPGGATESFAGLTPGNRYTIVEGSGRAEPVAGRTPVPAAEPTTPANPIPEDEARIFLAAPVPAPTIRWRDLDGAERSLEGGPAGPILLVLWTANAGPGAPGSPDYAASEAQLADLALHAGEIQANRLRVVALCVDDLDREGAAGAARALVERTGFKFDAGFAEPGLADRLDLLQRAIIRAPRPYPLPSAFLIDQDDLLGVIYKGPVTTARLLLDLPSLRLQGERRLGMALPFPGRRQTRAWPSFFDYMDKVAQAYADGGYVDEAIAYYDRVLKIRPGRVEAHFGLASALAGAGRTEDAVVHYRKVLEIAPKHAPALSNLGFALATLGQTDEAIPLYRQALEVEPANIAALNNLAGTLIGQGKAEEAGALATRALAIDADNTVALNNLALSLARQGRNEEAVERYRRVLELDPGNVPVHLNLGLALVRMGRLDEAVPLFSEAARLKPSQPEAHYHLGAALAKLGRRAEAAAALTAALKLRPEMTPASYLLGLVLARIDRLDEAIARFGEALRLPPGSEETVVERLAWTLATHPEPVLRDGATALALARALIEGLGKSEPAITTLETLAAAAAEAGQFPQAVDAAQRALKAAEGGPPEAVAAMRSRLKLYEAGKPFHESSAGRN